MPRWLDRPRRAGEAERAVNVRHHRRGRYSPYRRVVSRYPVVHGRLERASSAERMTPTEHVASRIVLDGGRTEGHGYAGQACPGRRCVRGRSHPSRLLPQFLPPTAVLASVPSPPEPITNSSVAPSFGTQRVT
jgi:hypothetical protein